MRRRAVIGIAVYAAILAITATPLFDATYGVWWLPIAAGGLATVAMGAAVARAWAVAVAAVATLALAATSDQPLLAFFFSVPVFALLAAVGWLAGRLAGVVAAGVLFAAALFPVAYATAVSLRRGEHVSPELQAALPVELSLNQLCPGASTPPRLARRLRRQAETLIREVRRDPNRLVTYTFFYEDAEDETRDITLRQLVVENTDGPRCMPLGLWRRLRALT